MYMHKEDQCPSVHFKMEFGGIHYFPLLQWEVQLPHSRVAGSELSLGSVYAELLMSSSCPDGFPPVFLHSRRTGYSN